MKGKNFYLRDVPGTVYDMGCRWGIVRLEWANTDVLPTYLGNPWVR